MKKHMRLPNGFGQISEIRGRNLRKPFRAMVTVGTKPNGRPLCKLLQPEAYFKTYNEAYRALVKYKESTVTANQKNITFREVYNDWYKNVYSKRVNATRLRAHKSFIKPVEPLMNIPVANIKPADIRACIENPNVKPGMRNEAKTIINMVLDFAVENEYVDHNRARNIKSVKYSFATTKSHKAFTQEEINKILDAPRSEIRDCAIIELYTGFRPSEVLQLKEINFEKWLITGGMKTKSGTDRVVPIHENIRDIIVDFHPHHGYNQHRKEFVRFMESLNITGHTSHDCRSTFITACKHAGVDEYAIKRLVGHTIEDITERVYTTRTIDWLRSEISKVDLRHVYE